METPFNRSQAAVVGVVFLISFASVCAVYLRRRCRRPRDEARGMLRKIIKDGKVVRQQLQAVVPRREQRAIVVSQMAEEFEMHENGATPGGPARVHATLIDPFRKVATTPADC